jgi:hypothetical protein
MSIVSITEANPINDVPACLGKKRFETELEARQRKNQTKGIALRVYYCAWCDGWHLSKQDKVKGQNKTFGRGKRYNRRRPGRRA